MLRVNGNLLVHAPPGITGRVVTKAASYAVRSLVESDAGRHDLHLTVVAIDCDNPAFSDWAKRLERAGLATIVPVGVVGFGQARNVGYDAANYQSRDWDVFIEFDSDNVFPFRWFHPLMKYLKTSPRAGIVSPGLIMAEHWRPKLEPSLDIKYSTQSYDYIHTLVDLEAERCVSLYGGRVGESRYPPVVRRPACLRDVGLYDGRFEGSLWGDWDEIMRLHQAGWEVRTCLDSFVFHWTAWEKVVLGGWQGRDPVDDDRVNRTQFFEKWPDAEEMVTEYNRKRAQLYRT